MDKAEFIKQLEDFYINRVNNPEGIAQLVYLPQQECVKVVFLTGDYKVFSVWGDNEQGMLKDFVKFLNNINNDEFYPWHRG